MKSLMKQMNDTANRYIAMIKPINDFLEYGSQRYEITINGGDELCLILMKYEDENECSPEELKKIRDIEVNARLRIYQQFE